MALHLPMTRRLLAALPLILAALLLAPQAASAQSQLDAYRMSGAVAERYDGFAEVRDAGAAPDAGDLVREVNAERRELYETRARETDVPVEEVGKLFATKIFERAPRGTYFRQPDGSYIRK